ncbi:MAG TPA: hypothetical protein VGG39_19400 [Polyangiaceae bacterium]|jgi:hypothetical protein
MASLPRPPTLKEIVMRSLLGDELRALTWREPHDTIVDADPVPTAETPVARDTLSDVFDLTAPPRAAAESWP